jgi:cytochrome c oxidase subunit 1
MGRFDPLPSPSLFALAFLPMFGIGGLTGLPLRAEHHHIPLHDTYDVIGHFTTSWRRERLRDVRGDLLLVPEGHRPHERDRKRHFWPSLIFMNGVFMPMFFTHCGMSRRLADGGYPARSPSRRHTTRLSFSAWAPVLAQILLISTSSEPGQGMPPR